MATNDELNELEQRIFQLRFDDQLHLFERVLAKHRRMREETVAEMLAANAAFLASEKIQRAITVPFNFPPEAKREAG